MEEIIMISSITIETKPNMNKMIRIPALLLLAIALYSPSFAQSSPKGWHLKDKTEDKMYGISLQKAYDYIKAKNYRVNPVIVAVIDAGSDTTHEDLKNVLWKNHREIAGNGKDDDGNGYIDDVYGWNFLGNKAGKNIVKESEETERAFAKYQPKWQSFDASKEEGLSVKERYEYSMWKIAAKTKGRPVYLTADSVRSLQAKQKAPKDPNLTRKEIVGDKYEDISDRKYGNADVMAKDPMHGSHVAGIIAAQRNNGVGMDGVADDALIMTIRAVPDGDERDKDIALAIRYAVKNGARVINMSFGKSVSPEKKWVDEAVKYAAKHDVLIVHAAGNESLNTDLSPRYPSATSINEKYTAPNFISVGASTLSGGTARFSNYGKKTVDVFAPGTEIYSTVPKGNKYRLLDGTSMASPVVAGIAALIREYFPALSAVQVKYIIEHSVVKPEEKVAVPGSRSAEKVELSELCTTGGIVNAYEAIKLASMLKGELKERKVRKILKVQAN
jgi:subtilisin family serine protease